MSERSHDAPAVAGGVRRAHVERVLALSLLAGAAGCSSSPQYPIALGERAGDGSIMSAQPHYAVSARDAAQNAADRASQAGYPAYGAPPMVDPSAPTAPAAPAPAVAPPPGDDMADDAPTAPAASGGAVESSDLPPPGAAPASPQSAAPSPPVAAPDAADVPPADPRAGPQEVSYAYGGGRVVFGMDWVVAPQPELAAYRHRRPHAAVANDTAASDTSSDETASTARSRRRRHGATTKSRDSAASNASQAAADTPYQTVVKPGETLGEVAERTHSSKAALTSLNDLKHPRHVKAGTVLKIPYRYTYDVQKGDTLYTIAHRFNQTPEQIAKLNGLKAVPTLQPGQTIQLPPDASDQGKRDHASASGPEPEAAPTRLADAALRRADKAERRSRRSRAAELNTQEANLPPQEIRRGRSSSRVAEATAQTGAAATPTPAPAAVREGEVATAPPAFTPHTYAPPATAPSSGAAATRTERSEAAPAARAYEATPSRPYEATTSRPSAYREGAIAAGQASVPYRTTTPATSTYHAATTEAAPGAAAHTYAARPESTPYRAATAAPSTYAAPSYSAGPAASGASQYANLTPPRYPAPATATGGASAYTPSLGRERAAAAPVSGGAASASQIASAGRGRFIWPLRGPVVSAFGVKGTGEYNNGMDISAAPGTAVHAAAGGEVVYAGSSIPGYGQMVLIKHAGGWVTAYAHLNRIEVRMHDTVAQGDEIGQAGQTGVVDRPELYFEVRYAASAVDRPRPVDPALVLPQGGG